MLDNYNIRLNGYNENANAFRLIYSDMQFFHIKMRYNSFLLYGWPMYPKQLVYSKHK